MIAPKDFTEEQPAPEPGRLSRLRFALGFYLRTAAAFIVIALFQRELRSAEKPSGRGTRGR